MANEQRKKSLYFDGGDPATYNVATEYKPGELGEVVCINDKVYQKITVDSGATSATPAGAIAAGDAAFWKDKSVFLVTNDVRFAWNSGTNGRNAIAGAFPVAATAGYASVIQTGGRLSILAASGGTWTEGNAVMANSGTDADFTTETAGTAPTYVKAGTVRGARTNGFAAVDLELDTIP